MIQWSFLMCLIIIYWQSRAGSFFTVDMHAIQTLIATAADKVNALTPEGKIDTTCSIVLTMSAIVAQVIVTEQYGVDESIH